MIVTTSICANYYPKAKTLAQSLKKHHPDAKFVLCLVERTVPKWIKDDPIFDLVLTPSDLAISNQEDFFFRYSIVEASTAVKGHLMLGVFERFPDENNVIYLDPDTRLFSPLTELLDILETEQIVLTPHLNEPEIGLEAIDDNEICALRHGVFNLGFLGLSRGKHSNDFMNWWADRLYNFCYADYNRGLFTDQRWIDLAPCFFPIFVLRHDGYNVAPWNLNRRKLRYTGDRTILSNEVPLRFFHFSGYDSGANLAMSTKYGGKDSPVFQLREDYDRVCEENEQSRYGSTPWSYNFYSTGERIPLKERVAYRRSTSSFPSNPFSSRRSKMGSFVYASKQLIKRFFPRFTGFVKKTLLS